MSLYMPDPVRIDDLVSGTLYEFTAVLDGCVISLALPFIEMDEKDEWLYFADGPNGVKIGVHHIGPIYRFDDTL